MPNFELSTVTSRGASSAPADGSSGGAEVRHDAGVSQVPQLDAPGKHELEIIVPALNEEDRIALTLRALRHHLAGLTMACVITVVDNGSADATVDVVKQLDSTAVPIRVIGCRQRGKGAAVKAGVLNSTARWVGFCDADLATPVAAIDQVIDELAAGAPVVIGSRRIDGARYTRKQPLVRRAGGWAFRALARPLTGDLADTQCGFKFFEHHAALQLFGGVASFGFVFDVELLAAANRLGFSVAEVPVEWTDRSGSSFRPLEHGPQVLRDLRVLRQRQAHAARADRLSPGARRRQVRA